MAMKSGITVKLLSTAVLAGVGFVVLAAVALSQIYDTMLEDRVAKVRNLTEVARGVMQGFHDRAKAGEFSQDTAKSMARETLRGMRYDKVEYFFLYAPDGICQLLPPKPQLEGTSLIDMKDADGVYLIRELINRAKAGGGPVFYKFPRPGSDAAEPKVSSAAQFEPWDWMVGTGIYIDDINTAFRAVAIKFGIVFAVVLLAAVALVTVLSRHIGGGVIRLVKVTERLASRDYTVDVPETNRHDEIGQLAKAVAVLRDGAAAPSPDAALAIDLYEGERPPADQADRLGDARFLNLEAA